MTSPSMHNPFASSEVGSALSGPRASPGAPVHLRLLGAVEATAGAQTVSRWPSRPVQLLLARLVLWGDRSHPREELVELLWPGVELDVGRNRLRQALSTLRDALRPLGAAEAIVADRHALRLVAGSIDCDVEMVRRALQRGDTASARALDRGELLPGHFDDWVVDERHAVTALLERHLESTENRGRAGSSTVQSEQFTGVNEKPAATSPLSELPRYLTSMHGCEVIAAALQTAVLRHRLVLLRGPGGVGKTRLAVEVAGALQRASETGPAQAPDTLHFDAVVFVPLAACQTRQAMGEAVLTALHHAHDAGAATAPLPPAMPDLAAAAIARPGDDRPQDNSPRVIQLRQRVVQALSGRRMLLVLDNFEQLVSVARDDLAWWLSRLPQLHLLVTSRHVLGLDGEHELQLESLPVPPARPHWMRDRGNPALTLLADRADAARPGFVLDEHALEDAAAVVRRLHGLPLAIELAAARLRTLGLRDLRRLLDTSLASAPAAAQHMLPAGSAVASTGAPALALLSRSGPRSADDARHASMLAVVDWSLARLGRDEIAMLQALAVFEGGATLNAAAAVNGQAAVPAATCIDELVASSVVFVRESAGGHVRYHVFEPVREVVAWRTDASRLAHLQMQHVHALAQWAETCRLSPELAAVRAEFGNLQVAWRFAADSARPDITTLALGVAVDLHAALDDLTLDGELIGLLRRLAAQAPVAGQRPLLLARTLAMLAEQCFERGERDSAVRHADVALGMLDAAPDAETAAAGAAAALVLQAVARVRLRVLNDTSVEALIDRGLALLARVDDAAAAGHARAKLLSLSGVLAIRVHGNPRLKLALDQQALALWQAHGPAARISEGLVNVALALGFLRRTHEELQRLDEARVHAARHGQTRLLAFICSVRGYALADLRRWDESVASYRDCLRLAWDYSAWREWFYALWNLPRPLAHQRRAQAAAQLLAFADRFASERFGQLGAGDLRERRRSRHLVRAVVGVDEEARLWQCGRELSMAEAMALAMG